MIGTMRHLLHRFNDAMPAQLKGVDLAPLKEEQGEGVALGVDNTVFLAGEGGGKGQPGSFARFSCTPRG